MDRDDLMSQHNGMSATGVLEDSLKAALHILFALCINELSMVKKFNYLGYALPRV